MDMKVVEKLLKPMCALLEELLWLCVQGNSKEPFGHSSGQIWALDTARPSSCTQAKPATAELSSAL